MAIPATPDRTRPKLSIPEKEIACYFLGDGSLSTLIDPAAPIASERGAEEIAIEYGGYGGP